MRLELSQRTLVQTKVCDIIDLESRSWFLTRYGKFVFTLFIKTNESFVTIPDLYLRIVLEILDEVLVTHGLGRVLTDVDGVVLSMEPLGT